MRDLAGRKRRTIERSVRRRNLTPAIIVEFSPHDEVSQGLLRLVPDVAHDPFLTVIAIKLVPENTQSFRGIDSQTGRRIGEEGPERGECHGAEQDAHEE